MPAIRRAAVVSVRGVSVRGVGAGWDCFRHHCHRQIAIASLILSRSCFANQTSTRFVTSSQKPNRIAIATPMLNRFLRRRMPCWSSPAEAPRQR